MIIIAVLFSLFSLGAAFFIFFVTAMGDPHNASLWWMGMIFLAGGAIGPVMIILNVRKENQRKGAIRARESEWGKGICDLLIVKRIKLE